MSQEQENLKAWKQEGEEKGAQYVLDVCDTFNYEHYPVYVMPHEDLEVVKQKHSVNMQSVYSVIEL